MNSELERHLAPVAIHRRTPLPVLPRELLGFECPKGLLALLEFSDGFITRERFFRVFGITSDEHIPSLEEWNNSDWKLAYGSLAEGLLFVAEDIFGDQYGYSYRGDKREFIKFYCEGGEIELLEGINWFLEALAALVETGAVDGELVAAAAARGLTPKPTEHLAFKVPLIIGGLRDANNIVVESVPLHLGTLAQLSFQNAYLADETPIAAFIE